MEEYDELIKYKITYDGMALQFVKNQTDEICDIAVAQNADALQHAPYYYKNPGYRAFA